MKVKKPLRTRRNTVDALRRAWEARTRAIRRLGNERLHPDLAARLVPTTAGPMIQHPLCHTFYGPHLQSDAAYNYDYRRRVTWVAEKRARRDWFGMLLLYEKPHRLRAFADHAHLMSDAEYWSLLHVVWTTIENPHQNLRLIRTLYASKRGERGRLMTDYERRVLAALPPRVRVYRGYVPGKNLLGWSWTLSERKAWWFAQRPAVFRTPGTVAIGEVAKADIVAYLAGRREREILVDPRRVHLIRPRR